MTPRGGARPGAGRPPSGQPRKANLCIRLPVELDAWVRAEAVRRGCPISTIIGAAVAEYQALDQEETA